MEKTVTKSMREKVWNKYGYRCAYCGNEIEYRAMQVDHIAPKREGLNNEFKNLNPSCRRCNHYKRGNPLSVFRDYLKTLHTRITADYIAKVGLDYGIITVQPFDGIFYFEKLTQTHPERRGE